MESLDTAIRLMVIGQLTLTALVLAVRRQGAVTGVLVLLQVCVAAFLVKSSPTLLAAVPMFDVPFNVLALATPYLVWGCAYILFEFARPPRWLMLALPATTLSMCLLETVVPEVPPALQALSILASLVAVGHALISVVLGSLDDLSASRRRFRLCFVSCISLATAFVLVMELVFLGGPEPAWLPVANVSVIALVSLFIHVPLMSRPEDLLPRTSTPDGGRSRQSLDAVERELHDALLMSMENRGYARTGLTIRQLAEELKTPEHQLRALINTRLGFKNFSTFLNGYRIDEACHRLRDPKEARIPILTIALDAGFASLAPFNRAFRQVLDMTPSEYRRQHLKPAAVVTPIRR